MIVWCFFLHCVKVHWLSQQKENKIAPIYTTFIFYGNWDHQDQKKGEQKDNGKGTRGGRERTNTVYMHQDMNK